MAVDSAQLSSLTTALEDISKRITELADQYQGSPREDVAADLYEVERHLAAATRRLNALLDRA
jgi:Mg2+ and Co2+ transporter CorA